MFSTEARIRTDRAGRYLAQLCDHTGRVSTLAPGNHHGAGAATVMPRRAEWSGTAGVIDFDRGRCTLRATGEELVLLVEAGDQQDIRLIQDALTARLHRIGRRDRLSPTWRPVPAAPDRADGRAGTTSGS